MRFFRNMRAYAFDPGTRTYRTVDGFVVADGRFASLEKADAGGGCDVIDLAGATVVAAFSDCHVHLTDTGYVSGVRDFCAVRTAVEFREAVAKLERSGIVLGGNYDDAVWSDGESASAAVLDELLPDAHAMLVRVDGHSSLVNRGTFAWLGIDPRAEGVERDGNGVPTGRLFLEANWRSQAVFLAAIPEQQRRAAERNATLVALREGALHLHVQLIGFGDAAGYAGEIAALAALPPARWYPKICEPDPALAQSLGLPFVGGDVFLDGSIGSATAAMFQPYICGARPDAGSGTLRFDDARVEQFFSDAERLGVSAGVHAIGDRAIEQCIAAWERVLGGRPSPRNRHFIEHFEVASPEQIERAGKLGLYLSMQPQFDALWGGPGGMYERRLGAERMSGMNALRTALRAGATLCGGDDSPVCKLSPLEGMAAACEHHTEAERLEPLEALTMYTYDAARLAHAESSTGRIARRYDADFVVLDRDPFAGAPFAETRVLATWSRGECVFDAGMA